MNLFSFLVDKRNIVLEFLLGWRLPDQVHTRLQQTSRECFFQLQDIRIIILVQGIPTFPIYKTMDTYCAFGNYIRIVILIIQIRNTGFNGAIITQVKFGSETLALKPYIYTLMHYF